MEIARAKRYIAEIVDPTIRDFETNPSSRRYAFLACVVTFHAIDYLSPPKSHNLRERFRRESPGFALVDRVAHAFKHVRTGNTKKHSTVRPLDSDAIKKRPPAFYGEAVYDLSRWDDPIRGITIDDEHEHDLLDAVKRAGEYLRGQIREEGT